MVGLDSNIFFQRAAADQANASRLQGQLESGLKMYSEGQARKAEQAAKGLDLDKLIDPILVKAQSGQELSDGEKAAFGAWQQKRQTEQMTDPYGNIIPKYKSLDITGLSQAAAHPYQPIYSRPSPIVSGGEAGSPFPAGFQNGSADDAALNDLSSQPISQEQVTQLMGDVGQNILPPQNINQPGPIADTAGPQGSLAKTLIEGSAAYGSPMQEKEQLQAGMNLMVDEAKDQADEAKKIRAEERKKNNPAEYTESQSKNTGYAKRMSEMSSILSGLPEDAAKARQTGTGIAGAVVSAIPGADGIGEAIVKGGASPEQQQYLNAAQEWIRAKLRKESGAAIGADEMQREFDTYFPTALDSPEVVAQKEALRRIAEESVQNESGGLYKLQYGDQPKPNLQNLKSKYGLD